MSYRSIDMPAICAVTGIGPKRIHKRSKSMQDTITFVKPNLQKVRIGNRQIKISARALRTMKKKLGA